jgi:flagellar biosynthetic protein FliP
MSKRLIMAMIALIVALVTIGPALAQTVYGPPASGATGAMTSPSGIMGAANSLLNGPGGEASGLEGINPISAIGSAASALPGASEDGGKRGLSTAMNILVVLTVLSLVPSIMLMTTCFLRIVIVLGLLKQALGTQQMPPSQVLLGLAMVMTMLVMAPTIDRINKEAIAPYQAGEIRNYDQLWNAAKQPLRDFMFDQLDATGNYSSLYMVLNYRGIDTSDPSKLTRDKVDMLSLVPAFVLSELKVAFLMGFKVYLPFLVIDMVISSILISMSMMMLPPVLISLPFKLLLFVMVDGWQLIVGSLMQSFVTHPAPAEKVSTLWPWTEPVLSAMGIVT